MEHNTAPTSDMTQCRRCGTCCRKGGPALHLDDQHLVESGKIPLKDLMTFRQGEPVFDNVAGIIAPAVTDIVRIQSHSRNHTDCVLYDRAAKGCRIYDQRPAECSALKCWDTREIEQLYNSRRLTRRHLLSKVEGLWDLVETHQDHCDYAYVAELVEKIRRNPPVDRAMAELREMIRYDQHIRDVTLERSQWDPAMLTFVFGRPLTHTIQLFDMKISQSGQGMVIEPAEGGSASQVCYRRNGFQR